MVDDAQEAWEKYCRSGCCTQITCSQCGDGNSALCICAQTEFIDRFNRDQKQILAERKEKEETEEEENRKEKKKKKKTSGMYDPEKQPYITHPSWSGWNAAATKRTTENLKEDGIEYSACNKCGGYAITNPCAKCYLIMREMYHRYGRKNCQTCKKEFICMRRPNGHWLEDDCYDCEEAYMKEMGKCAHLLKNHSFDFS